MLFTALDKLYLTTLSGGTPTRVTRAEKVVEHSPTWSPDGQWIVFRRSNSVIGSDLMQIPAAGGAPVVAVLTPDMVQNMIRNWVPMGDQSMDFIKALMGGLAGGGMGSKDKK